jgi:putative nucleotidyltransferase with HDIG domain
MNLRERLTAVAELPTIPTTITRILEVTRRPDAGLRDLARIVHADQALAGKLLRLANSAFYGQSEPVTDLDRAVALLGFNAVRQLALSLGVFDSLYRPLAHDEFFDRARFWEHCFVVAVVSRELAVAGRQDGGAAFTAGLLHDVGKLFLDRYQPDEFRQVVERVRETGGAFREAEQALLQVAHDEVGALLLAHWKLPTVLVEAARAHHDPTASAEPLGGVVYLANELTHTAGFTTVEPEPVRGLPALLDDPRTAALQAAGRGPSASFLAALLERVDHEADALSAQAAMLI